MSVLKQKMELNIFQKLLNTSFTTNLKKKENIYDVYFDVVNQSFKDNKITEHQYDWLYEIIPSNILL